MVAGHAAGSGATRAAAIDWALAGLFVVLPLLPVGPSYLGLAWFPWLEIGALTLVAVAIVSMAIERRSVPRRSRLLPPLWTIIPLAAVATGAAMTGLAAENPMGSPAFRAALAEAPARFAAPIDHLTYPLQPLRTWLTFLEGLAAAMLVAVVCLRAPDPARRGRRVLYGCLTGAALVSVFAIVQYVTRFQLHPYWVAANPDLTRSHATFEDPNTLGSFLVVALGLGAGLLWRAWGTRTAIPVLAALGLVAAGLATTVSRAAWGAPVLAVLVVAAWGVPVGAEGGLGVWQRRARAGMTVVGGALALWLVAHAMLPPRADFRPSGPIEAVVATIDPRMPLTAVFKDRQDYWQAAIAMSADRPWTGVGLGRFARLGPRYNDAIVQPENAHNFFLQAFAEAGILGFAAVVLALGAPLWLAWRAGASASSRPLAAGLSLAMTGLIVTSLTGHPLLLPSMQILVGGLVAAWCVAIDAPAPPRGHASRVAAAVACGSVVVLSAFALVAARTPWTAAGNPWGYAVGLHGHEADAAGLPFRWTGGEAWLHLEVPPRARVVELSLAALLPLAPGAVTTVEIRAGDRVKTIERRDGAWTSVTFGLPAGSSDEQAALDFGVIVEPARSPSLMGLSADPRVLGVALRPPVFHRPAGEPGGVR